MQRQVELPSGWDRNRLIKFSGDVLEHLAHEHEQRNNAKPSLTGPNLMSAHWEIKTFIINASGGNAAQVFECGGLASPSAHELAIKMASLFFFDVSAIPSAEIERVEAMCERELHLCLGCIGEKYDLLAHLRPESPDSDQQAILITRTQVAEILKMAESSIKTKHTREWKFALVEEGRGSEPHQYDFLKLSHILREQFPHKARHVLSHLKN